MSKTKLNIVIGLSLLSPIPFGFLSSVGQNPESYTGLVAVTGIFLGIPAIAIVGLSTSWIFRKSPSAYRITALGYAIPAILICCLLLLSFIESAAQG